LVKVVSELGHSLALVVIVDCAGLRRYYGALYMSSGMEGEGGAWFWLQ
jgi:hypothetical protein